MSNSKKNKSMDCSLCSYHLKGTNTVYPTCTECLKPIGESCTSYLEYQAHFVCSNCKRVVCAVCTKRFRINNEFLCSSVCCNTVDDRMTFQFIPLKKHGIKLRLVTENGKITEENYVANKVHTSSEKKKNKQQQQKHHHHVVKKERKKSSFEYEDVERPSISNNENNENNDSSYCIIQ